MTNALLVYPEFRPSFWSFKYALQFAGKKSSMPPLSLLTVAGMFPSRFNLELVDMNVETLTNQHLAWADIVFTSSMIVQRDSLAMVIERCNQLNLPIVAGGPHPTSYHEEIEGVNHFLLDEVEETFPRFLDDFQNGMAKHVYRAPRKPSLTLTPLPRYDLIRLYDYGGMELQFSRGCPFDCDFCDITKLYGRVSRVKSNEQMIGELELLYQLGWRGPIFLVDDNFIGNRKAALSLLGAITKWQKSHCLPSGKYPFSFSTEASLNLVHHPELLDAMIDAGFDMVFMGIETPNPEALRQMKKGQNVRGQKEDFLLESVKTIQQKGLEVSAGFILGADGDTASAFDGHIEFIQDAAIPMAMEGLLTVLKGTDLEKRLAKEGRLMGDTTGNNFETELNYIPELDPIVLIDGYKRVLTTIYDSGLKNYFARSLTLFERMNRATAPKLSTGRIGLREVSSFAIATIKQICSREGPAYLKFIYRVLLYHRDLFHGALVLAAKGHHFRVMTNQVVAVASFRERLHAELDRLAHEAVRIRQFGEIRLMEYLVDLRRRLQAEYRHIRSEFRYKVRGDMEIFLQQLRERLNCSETLLKGIRQIV